MTTTAARTTNSVGLGRLAIALLLPIGPAADCAERISAFRDAGAERIFVWPLADELEQLERFRTDVGPLVI